MWVVLVSLFVMLLIPNKAHASITWTQTSLTNLYLSSVETTPWGIVAGEYDTRIWNNPHNGLYISKNFGVGWQEFGLKNRGVTDIDYDSGKIYVTTYYYDNNEVGLYVSDDIGKTWSHTGDNFSTSTVYANGDFVFLGTFSQGLWVSQDGGESWEQKIYDGDLLLQVQEIEGESNTILASFETSTFISLDNGLNWDKISDLEGLRVKHIEFLSPNIVLAGTDSESGMYKSVDGGKTWYLIDTWSNTAVGGIEFFKDIVYAGRKNITTGRYDVYISKDLGETWNPTELPQIFNNGLAKDLAWVFSKPSYIFAAVPFEGVYKYEIQKDPNEEQPFLEIPWEAEDNSELIEKIYSFFDHSYPLLGYPYKSEPVEEQDTTLNYLGEKEAQPRFYYSSHGGYDFTLPYGAWVTAAAPGYATYGYDQFGLGNYITINHTNGYETTYAHLQNKNLVTTNETVWVEAGQRLGKIGMTGNTTGPHLHFALKNLAYLNPENRIDPFGWQGSLTADPWYKYFWLDSQGEHLGSKSEYVWNIDPRSKMLENKQLIVDQNSSEHNFTVFIEPYAYPKVPLEQNKLVYITGTSMLVNLYNILGEKIPPLFEPASIEVDISNANTENIKDNSIKIYRLNEDTGLWEPIETIADYINMKVHGYTNGFSKMAVFGINQYAWEDSVKIYNVAITI